MDENWLIFTYFAGLPDIARSFIDWWIFEHESFNDDGISKHAVTECMHVYESQCANLIDTAAYNETEVAFLATGLAVGIIQKTVDGFMVMQMRLKCDWESCERVGHWSKDCRIKHPHLRKAFEERQNVQRGRRVNKKNKRAKKEKKEKEKEEKKAKKKKAKEKKRETYDAVEVYASHSVFAAAAFFKLVAALFFNLSPIGASANIIANAIASDFVMT